MLEQIILGIITGIGILVIYWYWKGGGMEFLEQLPTYSDGGCA